jgi:hypothetical protein
MGRRPPALSNAVLGAGPLRAVRPRGVMAIGYDWTCTACGAPNAAGTASCRTCGCPAMTSGFESDAWRKGDRSPPLSTPKRVLLLCWCIALVTGVSLERATVPPDTVWYLGISLTALCLIVPQAIAGLRRYKMTSREL